MSKHKILISFNFKIEFIKYKNFLYSNSKTIQIVNNNLIERINDSIIRNRSKSNFVPYKQITTDDTDKDKFVDTSLETIVNVIHQKYNYINGVIYAILELEFDCEKETLSMTDIENLIYDNMNESYSNEKNEIHIDYEEYNKNNIYTYSLEITNVPEDIIWYSKQISYVPGELSFYINKL